ncbi:peptidyl-prolyl cis-trans isomerase [Aquimarina sp. 2-A2]|uniref:peptidyl-prolyl cis-trans isomerase n=1 Tax=Aquimarina sp. 2-A2 TaxID=3382644 RepID=UPI00387F04A9
MRYLYFIPVLVALISCENFKKQLRQNAVARVNESYLYEEDVANLVPVGASKEDSISIINNFINQWAKKQLFIDQAKLNLTEEEQASFEELIEDYRSSLYINAYKNAVVNEAIDLEISDFEVKEYYTSNIENFNLNTDIVQLRYLHLPSNYDEIVATQRKIERYNDEDKQDLLDNKMEYVTYSFNDSVWVTKDRVLNLLPILKENNREKLIKDGKFVQIRDSSGIYMIKILEVLEAGKQAPLEYMVPTIKQLILNRRKLNLTKNLEKDITKDAIKDKQFEIYN